MSYKRSEKGGNGLQLEKLEGGTGEPRKLGRIQKSLGETIPVQAELKRQLTFSNGRQ